MLDAFIERCGQRIKLLPHHREFDFARMTIKQLSPQQTFQFFDAGTERGLRDVAVPGRLTETQSPGQSQKHLHLSKSYIHFSYKYIKKTKLTYKYNSLTLDFSQK